MSEIMLTVAQVLALAPGDKNNASWIDPGFIALVSRIEPKQGKRPWWACSLSQPDNLDETVELAVFGAPPPFKEGDVVEFSGKGIRREEYNGYQKVAITKDTLIRVLEVRPPARQPAPAQHHQPAAHQPAPSTAIEPEGGEQILNDQLAKMARLYVKCWRKAIQIQEQIGGIFPPEDQRAITGTIFIECCKKGLTSIVKTTPQPAAQPQGGRADAPRGNRPAAGSDGCAFPDDNPGEDVPW